MLSKTEKKPTSKPAHTGKCRTLRRIGAEVARLRSRVDDIEDLRELNDAIASNADKPGIPWDQARKELGV